MNKLKRELELGGGFSSIIISIFLIVDSIVLLSEIFSIKDSFHRDDGAIMYSSWMMALSFITILLGFFVCKSKPIKSNTKYRSRIEIVVALIVVLLIIAIIENITNNLLFFMLSLIPMSLLIASLCFKHNNVEKKLSKDNIELSDNVLISKDIKERIKNLQELKESGLIDEETYKEKLNSIINNL